MRSTLASHLRLTMASWEPPLKMILIQLQEKLPRNSKSNILWSFGIWSKLERSQSSKVGVSWADQKSKQKINRPFEVWSSLILCNNNEPFLYQIVTCDKKWTLYHNRQLPAQWLDWEEASKHFPKLNLHLKNDRGHCLVVCCLSDPVQLSESQQNWSSMLSKSMRCTENSNTCSQRWSTERAQFLSMTMLTSCHNP